MDNKLTHYSTPFIGQSSIFKNRSDFNVLYAIRVVSLDA